MEQSICDFDAYAEQMHIQVPFPKRKSEWAVCIKREKTIWFHPFWHVSFHVHTLYCIAHCMPYSNCRSFKKNIKENDFKAVYILMICIVLESHMDFIEWAICEFFASSLYYHKIFMFRLENLYIFHSVRYFVDFLSSISIVCMYAEVSP